MTVMSPKDISPFITVISIAAASALGYVIFGFRNVRTDVEGFYICSGVLKLKFIKYTSVQSVHVIRYYRGGMVRHKTLVTLNGNKTINAGDLDEFTSLTRQLEYRCELVGFNPRENGLNIGEDDGSDQQYPRGYICNWDKKPNRL